jgi:hypothetical protein
VDQILVDDRLTRGSKMLERGSHIYGVPGHDGVGYQGGEREKLGEADR